MADVPQRLDLGLGKADPEEYFRRLALYSYAVAPLFPGRKQEGQYVPGLRQYATGGRILEDEFPTAYMPQVGRQVMQEGGAPSPEDQRSMTHYESGPGVVETAPVTFREPLSGYEKELFRAPPATAAALETAMGVAPYFTPAAPAFAARDVAAGMKHGDPFELATAALGAPGKYAKSAILAGAAMMPQEAQATFFSEAARMSPAMRQAFEAAKHATRQSMYPRSAFARYGAAPDPSGKIVGEISDAPARLIPSGLERFRRGEKVQLGELLSHPEVYDLYPGSFSASVAPFEREMRHRGYFDQLKDEIGSNVRLDDRDLLENLLHEHQHRVQHVEQMSPGTNPDVFPHPDRLAAPLKEDLQSAKGASVLKEFMERNPTMRPLDALVEARKAGLPLGPQPLKFISLGNEGLYNTQELLGHQIDRIYETTPDPYQQYFKSLGEVTARLPGERLEMSLPERRMNYPFSDESIIVRPPSPAIIGNEPNPEWEKAREGAIALARKLQSDPLPSRLEEAVSPEEEAMMKYAQELEAQRRAGRADGGTVKAALKMLGKLLPEGSGYAGAPGKPSLVTLPGIGKVEARPIPEVESAASKYMQTIGRPGEHEVASFPEFNPEFATKVADAFAEMKHRPGDPAVRRAYDALIDETMAQYRAAKDTGIDFRFLKQGQADPYAASPALGYEDIVNRGRLFVFPTEQGFGSSGGLIADNPLLRRAGKVGDKPDAVINDAFRIAHDLYGHFGPGNPFFRAPGEERAYQLHSRMFGKEALPAATLETRGQNSWVNYGPYGEANRSAPGATTHFAEQKIGRMPEWTQAPAPAVGEDVEAYIRSLTGKAEGGEVEEPGVVDRALGFLSQFNPVGSAKAETMSGVIAKALAKKIVPTVKNLAREEPLFPGVYGNPREMALEAESRVAPEDPIMKQLFGVTRQDVFDIAARRQGNMEPKLAAPPERTRGINYASEGVMTPENERRLLDILAEGEKQPGLRTGMMPWYYMDPVHARLKELFDPEEAAARYNIFNTTLGAMSPGSPVQTEINRGLGAYHLAMQGRLQDFLTHGGKPSAAPAEGLPSYVREVMQGHPYHSTSHAGPLRRFFETGEYTTGTPKVPLYIQASGVPETGFQTKLPVPDAHYTRILGMPDVRKTADPEVSMKMGEYRPVGPWFRESVARPAEMEAVPAQALLWGTGSGATGVDTPIGSPKLEMLSQEIANIARRRGVSPETARDLVLSGTLYASGGSVIDDAVRVSSNIANARELEAA